MSTAPTVKERPILFSGAMVRALLAGTKTQTRRTMKPQPLHLTGSGKRVYADADFKKAWGRDGYGEGLIDCPYGSPGERLWVRETIAIERWTRDYGDVPPLPADRPWRRTTHGDFGDAWFWPHYRATDPAPELSCERDRCRVCESGDPGPHWTPSIHMPRWACRLVLEITEVRVQRLQECSEDDAIAEGIDLSRLNLDVAATFDRPMAYEYRLLWDSINGAGAWAANPWVWALTFKRATP